MSCTRFSPPIFFYICTIYICLLVIHSLLLLLLLFFFQQNGCDYQAKPKNIQKHHNFWNFYFYFFHCFWLCYYSIYFRFGVVSLSLYVCIEHWIRYEKKLLFFPHFSNSNPNKQYNIILMGSHFFCCFLHPHHTIIVVLLSCCEWTIKCIYGCCCFLLFNTNHGKYNWSFYTLTFLLLFENCTFW